MNEQTQLKEFGLIEQYETFPKDYRAGILSGATKQVLREDGNYTDFIPETEHQIGIYFDTMGCVSFSALNCIETILKAKFGVSLNLSDRFLAKMSGTTKRGNYLRTVADSIRTQGAVAEELWPYPRRQRTPVFEWDDFYSEIPEEVRMEALNFLKQWKIEWEWVPMSQVREALKYGPLQVTVRAWPKPNEDGLYHDGGSTRRNHAVTLFNATDDYYEIADHYSKDKKKLVPNYDFKWALQFFVTKQTNVPMPTIELPNNVLVQLVEGSGGFGLHLDGKIIVDDQAKINASFIVRNRGDIKEKVVTLRQDQWDSFPKVNLKGEEL